jgi:hypothetical protein
MIPVIAPPLDEPSARTMWSRAHQETQDNAPPDQLPRPTDDTSGDRRSPSRRLSRHRLYRQWCPRTPASTALIGLSAAAVLAAVMVRRKPARASH